MHVLTHICVCMYRYECVTVRVYESVMSQVVNQSCHTLVCVAVRCSVYYSVVKCVAVCCSVMQCIAVCCNVCCSMLQYVAVCVAVLYIVL